MERVVDGRLDPERALEHDSAAPLYRAAQPRHVEVGHLRPAEKGAQMERGNDGRRLQLGHDGTAQHRNLGRRIEMERTSAADVNTAESNIATAQSPDPANDVAQAMRFFSDARQLARQRGLLRNAVVRDGHGENDTAL